jgi:hypothetical protein
MTIQKLLLQCAAIAMMAAPVSWCGVIQFSPSNTKIPVGASFTVDVTVDSVFDLYAIQFDLTYDPAVIAANSVTEGDFLLLAGATVFDGGTIDNTDGNISLIFDTLSSAISGSSGTGVLATFSFTALGGGDSPLQLANLTALDSSFNDVTLMPAAGLVSVTPEPATWLLAAFALAAICRGRSVNA